jgi:nitrite reductase (NO-forming)
MSTMTESRPANVSTPSSSAGPASGDGGGRSGPPPWDRPQFRFWVITITALALLSVGFALAALAYSHPKTTQKVTVSGSTAAAAPGQEIDFNADPPNGFKARDAAAPATPAGTVHNIKMDVKEMKVEIAPGVKQTMWTFDGTVPGPVYRGKDGDTFNFTITNDGKMTHSLDFHAGMVSPSTAMVPIDPGKSHVYTFKAEKAGIYMYHCGTPPVLMHIANGMYGALIVDPPDLAPVDHEYVMLQSDIYTGKGGALPEMSKLLAGQYDAVAFNGYVNQYKYTPIRIEPNESVRVWVLDDGPSAVSSFHVIGTIFDTVYKEGDYLLRPGPGGSQALDLMPAQGGFVEFTPTEAGTYPFVTHKFDDASRGGLGVFQVGEPAGPTMSH